MGQEKIVVRIFIRFFSPFAVQIIRKNLFEG